MQIQLNSDSSIDGRQVMVGDIEDMVKDVLARFRERITRVVIHVSDINSLRGGEDDKRCMMEARLAGRRPIAVTHRAPTIALAASGAAEKLKRSIQTIVDKLVAH